jgi:hypothetical protein
MPDSRGVEDDEIAWWDQTSEIGKLRVHQTETGLVAVETTTYHQQATPSAVR